MKILTVLGARPQFVKAAPLSRILRQKNTEVLVHTGQHYDNNMSAVFFEELGIPAPDYNLGIGSGTHGSQTGAMLTAIETVLLKEQPDVVLVYGDTNSTLAASLTAAKLNIPIAHVEAGLRSFNREMPEEINRILTDHISTWLFAPSESSREQLAKEGITGGVYVVGDIMYDAVIMFGRQASLRSNLLTTLGLKGKEYYLCTVHRPENTDKVKNLKNIFSSLNNLDKKVLLPLHPRTRKKLAKFDIDSGKNIVLTEPANYLNMLQLVRSSACVLTDSGGLQKEAYYLKVPCVTLRNETEWTETVVAGWNILCGSDAKKLVRAVRHFSDIPPLHSELYGKGNTAEQIAKILFDPSSLI